jgi:hypothetical protein
VIDEIVQSQAVEFFKYLLGERRLGSLSSGKPEETAS